MKKLYSEEEIEQIRDYISRVYHVERDAAVENFKVAFRHKVYDKEAKMYKHNVQFYKLGYIIKEDNLAHILNTLGKENVEISLNQFMNNTDKPDMKKLLSVNSIKVTIDYNELSISDSVEEVIKYLMDNVFIDIDEFKEKKIENKLPFPNEIIITNRLTLIYHIERCRIPIKNKSKNKNVKTLINATIKNIEEVLESHGFKISYREGLNGFIHLAGTIKTKYMYFQECALTFNVRCVYICNRLYRLQDILDVFNTREEIDKHRSRLLKNKVNMKIKGTSKIHNIRIYNQNRLKDIEKMFKIGKLGLDNGVISYIRIAYMYAVHLKLLKLDYSTILNRVAKLFDRNGVRVALKDIDSWIYQVKEPVRPFCADYMAEYFGLTEEICKEYGLNTFILTKGSKRYGRKEYNKEYYNTYVKTSDKNVKHLDNKEKKEIIQLYKDNVKVKDIAMKYGVSETTIYGLVSNIIKNKKEDEDVKLEAVLEMLDSGMFKSIKEAARLLKIDYNTLRQRIYRYKNKNLTDNLDN